MKKIVLLTLLALTEIPSLYSQQPISKSEIGADYWIKKIKDTIIRDGDKGLKKNRADIKEKLRNQPFNAQASYVGPDSRPSWDNPVIISFFSNAAKIAFIDTLLECREALAKREAENKKLMEENVQLQAALKKLKAASQPQQDEIDDIQPGASESSASK